MLLELGVRDLALIERARIALEPGFTVVTGETGAGKSLLIDALGLVLGGRADASLVRHGAEGARVEAVFERDPEPLICVRELSAAGRSLARVDDETVTAGRLAALAGPLVEIHGQHDQQRLLQPAWQRDVLDAYGGHAELRRSVAEAVRAWRANEAALRELDIEPAELVRRLELAEHAAAEIEAAGLRPGEVAELRSRLAVAGSAERIAKLLADAYHELAEEGAGARDRLARAARSTAEVGRLDPGLAAFADRLAGLEAEAADAAMELGRRLDGAAEEGTDVAALEERLSLIYGLLRKYGDDESATIAHGQDAQREADRLRGLEAERRRRVAEGASLEGAARSLAQELSAARRRAGNRLAEEIGPGLADLGFPAGAFSLELAEAALDESGADDVVFLLSPNPGEPARPLGRIASGGELSRVALALKVVLARADLTPTLVFDEVDAGIGGRSADPLGRSLWQLARHHQVICVTHLPQIAAYADVHLRITKHARDGRTVTDIARLDGAEREFELAQMLGASGGEAGALAAAGELLARAAKLRGSAAWTVA